jgi:hypothetical protein
MANPWGPKRKPIRRTRNFRLVDPFEYIDEATLDQAMTELENEAAAARLRRALRRMDCEKWRPPI